MSVNPIPSLPAAAELTTEGYWEQLPSRGYIHPLSIDPSDPQTLYAGTSGGVFKSINGSASSLSLTSPNSGENWGVGSGQVTTCRVKVTSLDNPSLFDVSDGNFTISGGTAAAYLYFHPKPKSTGSGAFSWEFDLNGTSFTPIAFFTQVAQNGFNITAGAYDFAGVSPLVSASSWPMLVGTFQ